MFEFATEEDFKARPKENIPNFNVVNSIKSCDLRIDPFGKSLNVKEFSIKLTRILEVKNLVPETDFEDKN